MPIGAVLRDRTMLKIRRREVPRAGYSSNRAADDPAVHRRYSKIRLEPSECVGKSIDPVNGFVQHQSQLLFKLRQKITPSTDAAGTREDFGSQLVERVRQVAPGVRR